MQPKRNRKVRRIFVGRDGMRAGWGVVLFVLIFIGAAFGISRVVRLFFPRPEHVEAMSITNALVMDFTQIAAVMIATGALALIERRSLFAYGLQGNARLVRLLSGAVCGFIAVSALVLTLWRLDLIDLHLSTTNAGLAMQYALLWALSFVMTGIFEEMLLRGYLQFTLTRGLGFWWAAIALSLLFGVIHGKNPGETWVGLVTAMVAGFILCMSLWYTGSIWWAIGFHAAWDWSESYFYGTADSGEIVQGSLFSAHPSGNVLLSGGATGPEGSVLVFGVLLIVALLMHAWWRKRRNARFAGSGWKPAGRASGARA